MICGNYEHLAEKLWEGDLDVIARELSDAYDGDKESRSDWSSTYAEGLDLLGMKYDDRTSPFPGASGVSHPLLAESVTQFQEESYKELLAAGGTDKAQVMGETNTPRDTQTTRVKAIMKHKLTHSTH